jgi:hypothetical protein
MNEELLSGMKEVTQEEMDKLADEIRINSIRANKGKE